LGRLSRDQEDVAGLYKGMRFAGVRIITLSEGEISNVHVDLEGTMNALYLQDIADKTKRRTLVHRSERGCICPFGRGSQTRTEMGLAVLIMRFSALMPMATSAT
jgi:hypothetical protein